MSTIATSFQGGETGPWVVTSLETLVDEPLARVSRFSISDANQAIPAFGAQWARRGVASYSRYTHRMERDGLQAVQEGLGRPAATCAVLSPIRKSREWWQLAQDERRAILEEESAHIQSGMAVLPAVARLLYQSHDLGEPFDFLTWFEFAPADTDAFDALLRAMHRTEEWRYVDREAELRLSRSPA